MTRRRESVRLPFTPDGVRQARAVVRACATDLPADLADNAELLVSEIVTNAVQHGAPELRLTVTAEDGTLAVEVADGRSDLPRTRTPSALEDASGRGLEIVELLSSAWGVEPGPANRGKTVWFRVTDSAQPEADRVVGSGQEKGGTAWN